MADPARYLLPTERQVINIRRHWAVLVGQSVQSILLLVLGILVARVFGGVGFLRTLAIWFCVFVVIRWAWIIGDWYVEKLIVTDKRVLLLTGIVTRKVAIMPLVKVTDLTYNRSATGLMLGYGQFVVETAGQDQALSTIDFVPRPEQLYIQISELLFGGDKGAPGALVTAAQREAEEAADQLARRRWRRFRSRRSRGGDGDTPPTGGQGRRDGDGSDAGSGGWEPATSRLDDLLARRDTLLADRDDPDLGEQGFGQGFGGDRGPGDRGYGDRGYGDRDDADRGFDQGFGEEGFGAEGFGAEDEGFRRPELPADEPRFHQPRRGEPGRGDQPGGGYPLPPRRQREGPTSGTEPTED